MFPVCTNKYKALLSEGSRQTHDVNVQNTRLLMTIRIIASLYRVKSTLYGGNTRTCRYIVDQVIVQAGTIAVLEHCI